MSWGQRLPLVEVGPLVGIAMRLWWVVSWLVRVRSQHPVRGDPARVSLVTDFRFSAVNPYSSQVRSTGPRGSLPFFKKKPWIVPSQDSIVGRDAHGAHAPRYWPLAGPSLFIPYSKGSRSGCRTRQWANLQTPRPRRAVEVFFDPYSSYL